MSSQVLEGSLHHLPVYGHVILLPQKRPKGFSNGMLVQVRKGKAHSTHLYQCRMERSAAILLETKASLSLFEALEDGFDQVLQRDQMATE